MSARVRWHGKNPATDKRWVDSWVRWPLLSAALKAEARVMFEALLPRERPRDAGGSEQRLTGRRRSARFQEPVRRVRRIRDDEEDEDD